MKQAGIGEQQGGRSGMERQALDPDALEGKQVAIEGIGDWVADAKDRELAVVRGRMCQRPRKTLSEIGREVGRSQERIRQIEAKTKRKMRRVVWVMGRPLLKEVERVASPVMEEAQWDALMHEATGCGDHVVEGIYRTLLEEWLMYVPWKGYMLCKDAMDVLKTLRKTAIEQADAVGLVDTGALKEKAQELEWSEDWKTTRTLLGLWEIHGSYGLRNTRIAARKAALISIRRPATVHEVAAITGETAEVISSSLGSQARDVVRITRNHWGLPEWDERRYRGIPTELAKRIEDNGGSLDLRTAEIEIARDLEVREGSVRTYANSPKFEVRNGKVRIAKGKTRKPRDLSQVAHGVDEAGRPYWTFRMHVRFLQGFSITGLPGAFAQKLGCRPEGRLDLTVANMPGAEKISLRWPLSSTYGATLGCVKGVMERVGVEPGARVRVTLAGRRQIELHKDKTTGEGTA